jgi:hypothetical protein
MKRSAFKIFSCQYLQRCLLVFVFLLGGLSSYATSISSNVASGNWNATGSWTPAQIPVAGDVVTILSGHTITATVAAAAASVTINSGGTLTVNDDVILTVTTLFQNDGTFTEKRNTLTFTGTGATLAGATNTNFGAITVNLTNTTDIVTMTASTMGIKYQSGLGSLTLTKGIFKIGSSNTFNFTSNGGSNAVDNQNTGGTLATTGTNGADGGTVVLITGGGTAFNLTGTGQITFYNLYCGSVVGTANRNITQTNANVKINGKLKLLDNNASWSTNSPAYGSAATLYIDNNGQGYTPGAGSRLEWMAMASGTIGTTAGYPHHVTIMNMGTSVTNSCGFAPSGTWCIDGTLNIGDGTTACAATLESMTAFTCGGINIDKSSTLKHSGETFTVKGDWTQQGSTTGVFTWVAGVVPVIFGGSGTSGSPQTISCSGSTSTITTLDYVTINNSTYVKVNCILSTSTSGIYKIGPGSVEFDYSATVGILNAFSGGPQIYLSTGNHTVTFAQSGGTAWSANYLYVNNWLGGYNSTGAGGSDPKLIVGTGATASDLSAAQKAKITFIRASNGSRYTATQLAASAVAEVVPTSTLPVELISFSGKKEDGDVYLNWQTASEINSDFYDVLRSSDGEHFESLGRLDAAHNSTKIMSYNFIDPAPKAGVNYYRLTEYDFDGKHQDSKVVAIDIEDKMDVVTQIYPNPTKGSSTLMFTSEVGGMYSLNISNIAGDLIYSARVVGIPGENKFDLNFSEYSSGSYFVTIINPQNIAATTKFVKED